MNKKLFLDVNSHLSMNPKALSAFIEFNDETSLAGHGHPQSPSIAGRAAANAIEKARSKIAELLGANTSSQIVFCSSCTQACEWGSVLLRHLTDLAYISPTEHPAMKQAMHASFQQLEELAIDSDGAVQTDGNFIDAGCSCIYIQNEIGIIQPLEKLNFKYLLSDMSQALGKIPINFKELNNVDIAVFGAHKFGGPVSIGLIYLKDTSYWKEFGTGSRYYLDRPGTPDAASAVATAVALEDAIQTLPKRAEKMKEFKAVLEPGLKAMGFEIIAENAKRCDNTTFVHMGNGKGIVTMFNLGDRGIVVGLGSACGSAYTGTTPLMEKLGRGGGPNDYIRISNWNYGAPEAKRFLDVLRKII